MQENTFLLHLFEKRSNLIFRLPHGCRKTHFSCTSLFGPVGSAIVRQLKKCGSVLLCYYALPQGGVSNSPPSVVRGLPHCPWQGPAKISLSAPPIPSAQLSLLVVSSSRHRSYYRLSYLQAVAGRQSPFCRPLARSLPYRSVAARGQAPLKGGQRYFHFLYGCLPPLLTSGCSHPINQQRHFLTSWRCFQGNFHFLSATATNSASP